MTLARPYAFPPRFWLTRGHIYPSTTSNVELEALLEDGTRVRGETKITASKGKINELFLVPPDVEPLPQTLDAIARADLITIGPGSLFTSLVPNLLVKGITQAILDSSALKVYVCNLMTQANESLGLTAADHIRALYNRHARRTSSITRSSIALRLPTPLKPNTRWKGRPDRCRSRRHRETGCLPGTRRLSRRRPVARHATDRVARDLLALAAQSWQRPKRTAKSRRRRSLSSGRLLTFLPVIPIAVPNSRGILMRMPKASTIRAPRIAIAIMAAGKGTRLKSKHPKVLHEVGGKPLLAHVIAAATQIVPPQDVYAIIGHEAERVRQAVAPTGIKFVLQEPQRGTGHALMVAREALAPYDHVIVLSGDAPLITPANHLSLRDFHLAQEARYDHADRATRKIPRLWTHPPQRQRRMRRPRHCGRKIGHARAEENSRDQFRHLCLCRQAALLAHRRTLHRQSLTASTT